MFVDFMDKKICRNPELHDYATLNLDINIHTYSSTVSVSPGLQGKQDYHGTYISTNTLFVDFFH